MQPLAVQLGLGPMLGSLGQGAGTVAMTAPDGCNERCAGWGVTNAGESIDSILTSEIEAMANLERQPAPHNTEALNPFGMIMVPSFG